MKTLTTFLLGISLTAPVFGEFANWTNKDGKSVELDLLKVTQVDGQAQGEFKMRSGRTATLKASDLAVADAKRLAEWQPPAAAAAVPAAGSTEPSVYDSVLDGNLVSLKGKSLGSHREFVKPTKYYLFYHTASWCGPCQKFTPSLVEFYNANKTGNDQFEIILVTHDSDEDAMEQYAAEKKMTWPHLKLSRVEKFNKEFKHPGRGIPNLVLTDTQGKILKTSYEGDNYLGPAVVMNNLGTLLKK